MTRAHTDTPGRFVNENRTLCALPLSFSEPYPHYFMRAGVHRVDVSLYGEFFNITASPNRNSVTLTLMGS